MPQAGQKPDDALDDEEVVLRRIPNRHDGQRVISKSQFSPSTPERDPEEGMSVDLLSALVEQGTDPTDPVQYHPEVEVIMSLCVGDLHRLGLWVVPRPLPGNTAHCNVLNVTATKTKKQILQLAEFFRQPGDFAKVE